MNFEDEAKKLLQKELKKDAKLEIPANQEFGDYAFPCFELAKEFKKNPNETAKQLASKLHSDIFEINALGQYVNFKIKKEKIASLILPGILKQEYKQDIGKGKKMIIEHTSINPNASPHLGRARNALIGDSLVRLYKWLGYNVESHYFVNDVGKQIAYLVLGCKGKPRFEELLKIYININKKAEKDDKIEKQALELLAKLEAGDAKTRKRFKQVVNICINGQRKIFEELGIKYDKFDYESRYLWDKNVKDILDRLERTGKVFTDEHGRKVLNQVEFDFAMKEKLLVLTRRDGTSLYPLRDLAYTIDKLKIAEENLVVLGEDHKLYFQQLAAALKILGHKHPEVVHYSFVLLQEGKMSTRQGNIVLLQEFMDELRDKAEKELKKRYKKVDKKLAKIIAYGALKYSILKVSHDKNVVFDWQQALSFEGDSAPYIQYSYTRASSILKKAGRIGKADLNLLRKDEEIRLVKHLDKFKDIVNKREPYIIAGYAFDLAKLFNEFYHNCQVINPDKQLMAARLKLVDATRRILRDALQLLGIDMPEKM